MKLGKSFVVEGLDGSGASTQIELLAKRMRTNGRKVFITKEPTDNVVGGLLRGILTGAVSDFPADGLQLLFSADRAHHLHKSIIPMLETGGGCDL